MEKDEVERMSFDSTEDSYVGTIESSCFRPREVLAPKVGLLQFGLQAESCLS